MTKVTNNARLIKGIRGASRENTAELESFHAAVNRFAPKMVYFPVTGMRSRQASQLF